MHSLISRGVEMASTGEVASFGKDIHEAYWAALLSVNGFKLPRPNSGFLIGGDINRPEMLVVAENLIGLGFKLYTHCKWTLGFIIRSLIVAAEVESHINAQKHLDIKKILVPVKDKRKLREVLEENEITSVINISRSRAPTVNDPDYASRRAAVDFGIPVSQPALNAQELTF